MKSLLSIVLIFSASFTFGQTKSDLLDCLKIVFERNEFQPAFDADYTTAGSVIIQTPESRAWRQATPTYDLLVRDLRQEDFFDFPRKVRVIREQEFEDTQIPERAILRINARGDEQELRLSLNTTIASEAKFYNWDYVLVKEDDQWTILTHDVKTRGMRITAQ